MSLANVLAAAYAAPNLILLGDPQQLGQPSAAAHPPGTEVSALERVLGNNVTMPGDRGLFIENTGGCIRPCVPSRPRCSTKPPHIARRAT